MSFSDAIAAADRASLEVFGEDVSYEPASGGDPIPVRAIFYNGHTETAGNDVVFAGSGPHFAVHREDVAEPKNGDKIERANGERFQVVEPIDDESTLALLRCRKTKG